MQIRPGARLSRFGGVKYIFRGKIFCVYYMFEKNFLGGTKFGGSRKFWEGTVPEWPPWLRAWRRCKHFGVGYFLAPPLCRRLFGAEPSWGWAVLAPVQRLTSVCNENGKNTDKTLIQYRNCELDLANTQVVPLSQNVLRCLEFTFGFQFAFSKEKQWVTSTSFIKKVQIPVVGKTLDHPSC